MLVPISSQLGDLSERLHKEATSKSLEERSTTPVLLNTPLTWVLPHVVRVREDSSLASDIAHDVLDGIDLVLGSWHGETVARASTWPSSLQDVSILLVVADAREIGKL